MAIEDATSSLGPNNGKNGAVLKIQNPNLENVGKNVDNLTENPVKVRTKLRNRQNIKNKDKDFDLNSGCKEASPDHNCDEISQKCVNKVEMSKEKVTKLANKFSKEAKNAQTASKMFGFFKRSQPNDDSGNAKSPKNGDKTRIENPNSQANDLANANSAIDPPENSNLSYNENFENNYRNNGIRAGEAEMNRQRKLMENKRLLKDQSLEAKKARSGSNALLLRSATKKIHHYILNKPKSANIPSVLGHYPVLISTTFIIIFVFLSQLILNKVSFNGRCVSKVLYPDASLNKKPYHVVFGYSACEYNLQQKAESVGFMGAGANDKGWPAHLVLDEAVVESSAAFDAPNNRIFNLFGSLDANYIRNYDEKFRLFWSMFMHKGLLHLMFNLMAQSQILWIIEPDWGFFRTASTFFISGLVGNLAAAVFEPSFNVLGSSGCLFGLIASFIPYCIENWTLLASPIYIFIFALVITVISLSAFTTTVSVYSHFGGWIGGLLWGFASLRSSFNLKDCAIKESLLLSPIFRSRLTPEARNKIRHRYQNKQMTCVNKIRVQNKDKSFSKKLMKILTYPYHYLNRGFYDIMIRVVPLVLLVVIVVVLSCFLFVESLYSTMFPLDEQSNLAQCCYLFTKGEAGFVKRVFWCFESFQTAQELCETS